MSYSVEKIRNVCLLGHGGNGKTALAESLLYLTGAIDRMGKATDGNTVCDNDPEEIKRQISISLAVAPVEYKGCRINILDTPGCFDFAGEVVEALSAADLAIIVCSAKDGISVGLEKAWKFCEDRKLPRFFFISKADEDESAYSSTLAALQERFGTKAAPLVVPTWTKGLSVVSVLNPGDKADVVADYREALKESVAETSEEFMEKFFGGEEFTDAEMLQGVRQGVRDLSIFPVLAGSAVNGIGTEQLLQMLIDLAPNPVEGVALKTAEGEGFVVDAKGVPTAYVFKTVSDQYGKYTYIKVLSGEITSDLTLVNARTGDSEKLGRLYVMKGKKAEEVKSIGCGDIGAIGKMDKVKTGDTLCDSRKVVAIADLPFAEPCYSMAIYPKTRGQEDKVAQGLHRLNEEDPSFYLVNNAETHQMVLYGAGDIQLDVLCAKLKSRFSVDTELKPARVAYREKIKGKVEVHGRHKKQSGGSGQFGDVWIRFEPQEEQDDMIFAEEVFGGSVPKNFFPSVEKGLRNAIVKGVLAGYPLVGLKATLYDGSYHPVDSNDMAFQTAARIAYQDGIPKAKPTILEPIGQLLVTIPDANLGDIMSDISSKRRGTVLGMTAENGMQTVEAEVPMAEMSSYTIDLRSMTQGRGYFTCKFIRYEEAPANVQQKVIEEAKALAEE